MSATLSTHVQPKPWVFVEQQAEKYQSQNHTARVAEKRAAPSITPSIEVTRIRPSLTLTYEEDKVSRISKQYLEAIKEDSKNQSFGLQRQATRQFSGYSRKLPITPYEL